MNCSHCHGEFGPLPPIAVFVDTALAGEFCSIRCLHEWSVESAAERALERATAAAERKAAMKAYATGTIDIPTPGRKRRLRR